MSPNETSSKLGNIRSSKGFKIAMKILSAILYGILALVMVVLLWLGFDKLVLKSPVPSFLGYATLSVETGSMASEIQIGDLILIKDTGDYKIGDIITYAHEGDIIPTTHRIIGRNEDGAFITRGDANNTADREAVTEDIIFGEVIEIYPRVGLFSKWVGEEGWIYIASILAIIALGAFVVKSQEEQAAKASEAEESCGNSENSESCTDENKSDEENTENENTDGKDAEEN